MSDIVVYCGRMYQLGGTRVLVKREAYPVPGIPKLPLGVYALDGALLGYLHGFVGDQQDMSAMDMYDADTDGTARYPAFNLDRLSEMVESYNGTGGAGKVARDIFPRLFTAPRGPLPNGWRVLDAAEDDRQRYVSLLRVNGETKDAEDITVREDRKEAGIVVISAGLLGLGGTDPIRVNNYATAERLVRWWMSETR